MKVSREIPDAIRIDRHEDERMALEHETDGTISKRNARRLSRKEIKKNVRRIGGRP